jgi:hypothetical protein
VSAGVDGLHPFGVGVHADDLKAAAGQHTGHRQPDITQADDADIGGPGANTFNKL